MNFGLMAFAECLLNKHILVGCDFNAIPWPAPARCEHTQKRLGSREKRRNLTDRASHRIDYDIAGMFHTVHHSREHVVDAACLPMYAIENIACYELELVRLLAKSADNIADVVRHRLDFGR